MAGGSHPDGPRRRDTVEAAGLQERVGDHRHQRVSMQTDPGSSSEVVETELFFHLLVRLLADPARFDRRRKRLERRVGRQVRQVVLSLPVRSVLADQPDFFPGHVLVAHVADALRWAIGDAHPQCREPRCEPSLGAAAPADGSPGRVAENRVRRYRLGVGDVVEPLAPRGRRSETPGLRRASRSSDGAGSRPSRQVHAR